MGILDTLKKLLPKGAPPPPFEPQCAQDTYLTIRLPTGWQFTRAEWGYLSKIFVASGPGDCSAKFYICELHTRHGKRSIRIKKDEVEKYRDTLIKLVKIMFKSDVKEMKAPEGLLWWEAEDVLGQNRQLQIHVTNTRLRNPELVFATLLHVIYTMPAASAGGSFDAERLEALRSVVRGVEWN